MKVNIGICDDDKDEREALKNEISKLVQKNTIEVFLFDGKSSLYEFFKKDELKIDILFLDIELGKENGIDIGRNLKIENDSMKIIFISNFPEYVFKSFDVFPVSYLLKPIRAIQLREVIFFSLEKIKKQQANLILFKEYEFGNKIWINSSKIIMLKVESSSGKKLKLYTSEGDHIVLGRMKPFFEELDKINFCQVYRDTIINIDHINKIYLGKVYLSNGMLISISRRYSSSFKSQYHKYKIQDIRQ